VCGTGFGRIYLAGVHGPDSPFELAGILARGSARSLTCARRYGVPLFFDADRVPEVDLACVVVGAGINGGPGAALATALLRRGIPVLQEHPLHTEELAGCLREARERGVHYRVNTHHVHVEPVRRFVTAARSLLREQPALFVDATTSFQVLYTLLDIIGSALGRLRPWGFAAPVPLPAALRGLARSDPPYRSLDGVLGGVPLTLRVQHQVDPGSPDNYAHLWHRVTIGTEGGNLTLVSSTGPVIWCTRPHMPESAAAASGFDELDDGYLDHPSAQPLGPATAPSWAQVLRTVWPRAVRDAVADTWTAVRRGDDPLPAGQYHLGLAQVTREVTERLGPVELVRGTPPRVLAGADILAGPDLLAGADILAASGAGEHEVVEHEAVEHEVAV
jgi:thiazolinyl imide reductase